MVAIHIPRPAEEWVPAHGAPEPGGEVEPRVVAPSRRVRPLPDRATRVRRRRLVALVAAVALVALLVVGVQALAGLASGGGSAPTSVEPPAAEGSGPVAGASYVVQPGDTLWSIAATIAPDDDPREVVDALRSANGGADLQVGQRLDLDLG
jgi:hypothetical protein